MAKKKEDAGSKESKKATLKTLMAAINQKCGMEAIGIASEIRRGKIRRIPVGIPAVDIALGGGTPQGRIVMHKGFPSTGKSLVAYKQIASFQKRCRHCLGSLEYEYIEEGFSGELKKDENGLPLKRVTKACCDNPLPMMAVLVDLEYSYEKEWVSKLGVDTNSLLVVRTESAEDAVDIIDSFLRSEYCDIVVIDSIAQMTPAKEIEVEAAKDLVGNAGKIMSRACRKWTSSMNSWGVNSVYDPTIVVINQFRDKISLFGGKTSPGGKALDFYESVELEYKQSESLNEKQSNGEVLAIGAKIDVTCKKNKTAPALRMTQYSVYYRDTDKYVAGRTDMYDQIANLAVFWGIIEKKGGWYYINDELKVQGKEGLAALLETMPDKVEEMWRAICKKEGLEINYSLF